MLVAEPKLHEWFDKIKRAKPAVCMTTDKWQPTRSAGSRTYLAGDSTMHIVLPPGYRVIVGAMESPPAASTHKFSHTVSATSARFVCWVLKSSELHLHSCCDDSQRAITPWPLIDWLIVHPRTDCPASSLHLTSRRRAPAGCTRSH